MAQAEVKDAIYRERLLEPIRVCARYRPAFGVAGREQEFTVNDFQKLFSADPLYSWLGLNSPLMYAAHKAAGGMTSIYRQIGIGCERLFRAIIQNEMGLSDEEVRWGYDVTTGTGPDARVQRLTLDARIDIDHLKDKAAVKRMEDWLVRTRKFIGLHTKAKLTGAVFEVRQGYKSADSKRQNADLRFGLRAYDEGYLPVIPIFSNQVSSVVASRYRDAKLLVLTGTVDKNDCVSTFAFCENVVGYSLAGFFERNTGALKKEMTAILEALLSPSSEPPKL
jgi:hypothetical protein